MAKKITEDGEIVDELCEDCPTIMVPGPFWKTPFNHDRDAESSRLSLKCTDPSKTQQQFAKDADINVILAKFLQTGELTTSGVPKYQNFDKLFDLQDEMITGYEVEQAWNALPAAARNILKDPKVFVDYVEHCLERGDLDPLRELGLAVPKAEPAPTAGGGAPPLPGGDKPA